MKRTSDSTGAAFRPNPGLNDDTAAHPVNIAANVRQAATAPAPAVLVNVAPATTADRLLAQANPANGRQDAYAVPTAALATTLPRWSGAIPVQADWPELTLAQRAERGDANAQYELGSARRMATPAAFGEARTWLEKAAAQNHGDAEYELGLLHEAGEGVPASKERAFEWFERSANHGSTMGQRLLGEAYLNGAGVEKNKVKACAWFAKAEAGGDLTSKTFLGYMYYKGAGVEQDLQKAMRFICAANYDDEKSINIDWELGAEYLKRTYPEDVNVLLPHLFSVAKLNVKAKHIKVNGPVVNDQGALAIAATLRDNCSIKTLNLSRCQIGEEGAKALRKAVYSTATPLKKIVFGGQAHLELRQIVAMNKRLAQNPQILQLKQKYIQDEVRFESRIELPSEVAQMIVQELILNDQTKRSVKPAGLRYATREETEKRVEELLYVIGTADAAPAHQV